MDYSAVKSTNSVFNNIAVNTGELTVGEKKEFLLSSPENFVQLISAIIPDPTPFLVEEGYVLVSTPQRLVWRKVPKGQFGLAANGKMAAAALFISIFSMGMGINLPSIPVDMDGNSLPEGTEILFVPATQARLASLRANSALYKAYEDYNTLLMQSAKIVGGTAIVGASLYGSAQVPNQIKGIMGGKDDENIRWFTSLEPGLGTEVYHLLASLAVQTRNCKGTILTTRRAWDKVQDKFDLPLPSDLYFMELGYSPFSHTFTVEELEFYGEVLDACFATNMGKRAITLSYNESGDLKFSLDTNYFTIKEDGVYDDRDRRFNNILTVPAHCECGEGDIPPEYMSFVSSHGAFIMSLLECLMAVENPSRPLLGELYKTLSRFLPMESEEETGAISEGDRNWYNLHVTKAISVNRVLPLVIDPAGSQWKLVPDKASLRPHSFAGQMEAIAKGALESFHLAQSHKGSIPLFSSGLVMQRIKDVPEQDRLPLLRKVVETATGKELLEGLKEMFPEYFFYCFGDTQKFITMCVDNVIIAYSTKLQKITKRVLLCMSLQAAPLGDSADFCRLLYNGHSELTKGHNYKVAFCPNAINTPGGLWQLSQDLKPFRVKGTRKYEIETGVYGENVRLHLTPEYANLYEEENEVVCSFSHISTQDPDGNVHPGIYSLEDGFLVSIPYGNGEGYYDIKVPETCFVEAIRYSYGNIGQLNVVVEYSTIQREAKLRAEIKATCAKPNLGNALIYNSLNHSLPLGIELVVPGDADKSKDLLMGLTRIITQTNFINGRNAQFAPINEVLGYEGDAFLVWDELLAAEGGYDPMVRDFIVRYARPLWLQQSSPKQDVVLALKTLFTNKAIAGKGYRLSNAQELLTHTGWDLTGVDGVSVIVSTYDSVELDGKTLPYGEVFVFIEGEDEDLIFQRTLGFVGTSDEDHVWLNARVELSSVGQSVGITHVMPGVPRCIGTGMGPIPADPALAANLMAEDPKLIGRWSAIQAMMKKAPIINNGIEVEVVKLLEGEKLTARADELLTPLREKTFTFEGLAHYFKDIAFDIGLINIWLPGLAAVDPEASSAESLNGLVFGLMKYAIFGDIKALKGRIARIFKRGYEGLPGGALGKLATSDGFFKSLQRGRLSAQGKALGVFGVPIHLVVVQYSNKRGSFYRQLVRAFKASGYTGKIHGQKVLMSRAPIVFPQGLEIHLARPGDPLYFACNEYQPAVNPLVPECNGGDNDGDIYVFTPAHDAKIFPLVTYDTIMEILNLRTGKDALGTTQEAYIVDHYTPKGWSPSFLANPTLLSKKHIGSMYRAHLWKLKGPCPLPGEEQLWKKALKVSPEDGFMKMMKASTVTLCYHVGITHEIAVSGEIAAGISRAFKTLETICPELVEGLGGENLIGWLADEIALPGYELYEAGTLGGLNWPSYHVIERLKNILWKGEDKFSSETAKVYIGETSVSVAINIVSNADSELGAALTNPTVTANYYYKKSGGKQGTSNSYTVSFRGNPEMKADPNNPFYKAEKYYQDKPEGQPFVSAEQAYKYFSNGMDNHTDREALMVEILTAKLEQHPVLVNQIEARGGVVWLSQCTHITKAGGKSPWEGKGLNSGFIRALVAAYKAIKGEKCTGQIQVDVSGFEALIADAGMNASKAREFLDVTHFCYNARSLYKPKQTSAGTVVVRPNEDAYGLIQVATHLAFYAGKANLVIGWTGESENARATPHLEMMKFFWNWHPEVRRELAKYSVAIAQVDLLVRTAPLGANSMAEAKAIAAYIGLGEEYLVAQVSSDSLIRSPIEETDTESV